jgi:hypothetical protein
VFVLVGLAVHLLGIRLVLGKAQFTYVVVIESSFWVFEGFNQLLKSELRLSAD